MKSACLVILFLLFFARSTPVCAQFNPNYGAHLDEINKGKLSMVDSNINAAISHYEKAVHYFGDNKYAWFDLGLLYQSRQDYRKARQAYGKAALMGFFPCEGQVLDGFPDQNSPKEIQPFVKELDSLKAVFYGKYYNRVFADKLNELNGADQMVRKNQAFFNNYDTTNNDRFYAVISYIDTACNLKSLLAYLDTHPFPASATLDEQSSFWIIVHHCLQYNDSNPLVARLKRHIEQAVYEGKYELTGYIRTLDYYHLGTSGKQWYGTYKSSNKEGRYIYAAGIDSIEMVDARRAAWHLPPIYQEIQTNDLHPLPPAGYDVKTQITRVN